MSALVIALGNELRQDDGVAHAVLKHLEAESRSLRQLTPEIAADIAHYDTVVFVDADTRSADLALEPLAGPASSVALTHPQTPAQIVAFSRALFGFSGHAFLCRIPAANFSYGEGLTPPATALAKKAASRIAKLLRHLHTESASSRADR